MSKLKKRLLVALTLFCSFFALVACSENKIADKPENSAVYDQAKVLSKETIKKIDKINEEADNTDKKLKIGVYIMDDLNGKDVEDTSLEIARKWKIGDKDTNNGVLLFLAIKDKKSLSTRVYDLSDEYPNVQRDLYSAFLIRHIENGHYQQEQLNQDFPDFYQQMKDFLQQPIKTERLAWYLK